jgi:hypothetical protein
MAADDDEARDVLEALDLRAGVSLIYEDNAWRFSDAEREDFRADPAGFFLPGVESLSDWYLSPFVSIAYQRPDDNSAPRYRVFAAFDRYRRNDRLDREFYYAEVRKRLSRQHRVILYTDYSPEAYVGESESGGPTSRAVREFVTTNTLGAKWRYRPSRHTRIRLFADVARDDYSAGFDDQDSTVYTAGVNVRQQASERWTVRSGAWWQLRNAGELTTISRRTGLPVVINDISSYSYRFDLGASYRLFRDTRLSADYRVVRKKYLTESTADASHYARRDRTHRVRLGVRQRLPNDWYLKVFATYSEKESSHSPDLYTWSNSGAGVTLGKYF